MFITRMRTMRIQWLVSALFALALFAGGGGGDGDGTGAYSNSF